jgi:hypothetical protein
VFPACCSYCIQPQICGDMSGQVILFTCAKEDGFVKVVSVLASPDTELEAEARQAVRLMRCEPMKVSGKQVDWDLGVYRRFSAQEVIRFN